MRKTTKRRRKRVPLLTKLAAALLALNPQDREWAKQMTATQYVSLFEHDHVEMVAFDGDDHFTNLTPMLIKQHRAKSAIDVGKIAKAKRLSAAQEEHRRRMLQPAAKRKAQKKSRWPKRKIPSRPFRGGRI